MPAIVLGTRDVELKDTQSWPSRESQAEAGKVDVESDVEGTGLSLPSASALLEAMFSLTTFQQLSGIWSI